MPNSSKDKNTVDSSADIMRSLIQRHLTSTLARYAPSATLRDWWGASSLAVRDTIHERMIATQVIHNAQNARRIFYFSMEYLMGRLYDSNLLATGLTEAVRTALSSLGVNFDEVRETEVDMGLGNGGLGRLAACFLDSLATLDYPALGYGIHYEFGLFQQEIVNGSQVEHPDRWMLFGSPWEVIRADYAQEVKVYGRVINAFDDNGNSRPKWIDARTVLGVPHDIPTAGFGTKTVNLLRLWASRSTDDFDLAAFNSGGYVEAVALSSDAEHIITPSQTGPKRAIARAYAEARITPADVSVIDLHATGTPGDLNELTLVDEFITNRTRITARKGQLGHGMANSGGWELTAMALGLNQRVALPTGIPADKLHPRIPHPEAIVTGEAALEGEVGVKLMLGIGGLTACVVLRRA